MRTALESDTHRRGGAADPPELDFRVRRFGEKRPYDYTRSGNPTRDALAEALAELERGAGAVVTSSGMAAITFVCHCSSRRSAHRTA